MTVHVERRLIKLSAQRRQEKAAMVSAVKKATRLTIYILMCIAWGYIMACGMFGI